MSRSRITNEDIVGILQDAADRLVEEGSREFVMNGLTLMNAITVIKTLPESYREPTGEMEDIPSHQIPLTQEFDEHVKEAVRLSDGLPEYWRGGVFHRKVRTYEGHPYLVVITDLEI